MAAEGLAVTASSVHPGPYAPKLAFDGKGATRWASAAGTKQPEWLQLDLGKVVDIAAMAIVWERACAVEYEVQVSDDGKVWRALRRERAGHEGENLLHDLGGRGRYLRILCLRPTGFDLYSIWEVRLLDAEAAKALAAQRAATAAALARAAAEQRRAELAKSGEVVKRLLALGIEEIVFAARECGVDGHWYANFGYYAPDTTRKCFRAQGRLCRMNLGTGELAVLVDDPGGSVRDPVVSYDARRILFSWRPAGADHFHLYEIDSDGSNRRQLTEGKYDDIEPCYLPDGGIVFVSSRCRRWVNCWLTQVAVLYRCAADGSDIRRLSANIEQDNTPWVLPDGRLLYQRWEYVDRSQVHYHHLWTANPDGTGQMVYYGNQRPGHVFIDAKPIPGTDEVVLIDTPGHGAREHEGHVAVLTPKRGPDAPGSLSDITGRGFRDPYAVSRNLFLAARGRDLVAVNRQGTVARLLTLPKAYGGAELHEPRPLVSRPREAQIVARTAEDSPTGRLILQDVYRGRNMEGVARGEIKELLILESLPKPINFTGGMEPLSYGGTFTLERVVGTVPVEADGSAYLELPANRAFFFVALDGQRSSVKRMQSFTSVMPGETTSCVGCHEPRTSTPPELKRPVLQALRHSPRRPMPVPGVPEVFDFPRDIQPILDRHCVGCHRPDQRDGGVLLTGDRGPLFSHSYFTLSARRQIADGRNRAQSNYPPKGIGDSASPLIAKTTGGHHDVEVTGRDLLMLRMWINTGAPYPGTYAALGTGMVGGYAQNRIDRSDLQWANTKAAQKVLKACCAQCHKGKLKLPDSPSDNMGMPPWAIRYGDPRLRFSRHILYDLTRPEKSVLLLAPLAREAGGWAGPGERPDAAPRGCTPGPVFAGTDDPRYQTLLAAVRDAAAQLEKVKRFDMPDFRPRDAYLREMVRYGVLRQMPAVDAPVDPYALDRAYWHLFAYQPGNP